MRRHLAVPMFISLMLVLGFGCRNATPPSPVNEWVTRAALPTANDKKVVILVIDGSRQSETFDDPTHVHVPTLWTTLRPLGSLVTSFRNDGWTQTNPGHSTIVTGVWQYVANDGSERPHEPTLFEYYRKYHGVPQNQTYVVSGKSKLDAVSYSTDPAYGAAYGAATNVGYTGDLDVYPVLLSVLENQHPNLVLACLPSVDLTGHSGVWANYLGAIETADSLAGELWTWLQQDAYYAGKTYLFITNDHGRHDDSHGGFQNHGDTCEGCRRLLCMALGPDIRQGYATDAMSVYTQQDICGTVARILEFPVPQSEGQSIDEIFVPTSTGIQVPPTQ